MIRHLLFLLALSIVNCLPAEAQTAYVINGCNTVNIAAATGTPHYLYMDQNTGDLCTSGPTNGSATTAYGIVAPATVTAEQIKATAGTLFDIQLSNISASAAWLHLYNLAAATCSSATGIVGAAILIPSNATTAAAGAGNNVVFTFGKMFTTGISFCISGGQAAGDTTAITASAITINADYQ